MSRKDTDQKVVELHQLLARADNQCKEANTLCVSAVTLALRFPIIAGISHVIDSFGFESTLPLTWVKALAVTLTYLTEFFEERALSLLNYFIPSGPLPRISNHPAHRIKYLYCSDRTITTYQASLKTLVANASTLLTILYLIGIFICFGLPVLYYFRNEMTRPAWTVVDPLAEQATTCFEQHCVSQFQDLGVECIKACEDTLHYTIGPTMFKYVLEEQSMKITYTSEQQAANQAQAQQIIRKFFEINNFKAVEWILRMLQSNRQNKQKAADEITSEIIQSLTLPIPKIETSYAGLMLKLAPQKTQETTIYDRFLDGLQAIWQYIFFTKLWNYIKTCKGIHKFQKRMKQVISTDCSLEAVGNAVAKETTIFKINCSTPTITIDFRRQLPSKAYFIELQRALMSLGISTYHINGILYISYSDISQEETNNLRAQLQTRLASLYTQSHACLTITQRLNRVLSILPNTTSRALWDHEIFNYSNTICVFYLRNVTELFFGDGIILEKYLSALSDFFCESTRIVNDPDNNILKIIHPLTDTWINQDVGRFQSRMSEALEQRRQAQRKAHPVTIYHRHQTPALTRRITNQTTQVEAKPDPNPSAEQEHTNTTCRSILFGNGIQFYLDESDKDEATTTRAYQIEVDWLESGSVYACIPEQTLQEAEQFTTRQRLTSILARGRTHGRRALNTGNSAQGIQIEDQPYKDVFGHDHLHSFGKIKTTHNVGIFGSMREVTAANGEKYHLVTFDGIPGLRH